MVEKNNLEERGFKGVWIPKEIYLDKKLSWTEKILLIEINSLDTEKGCFASNRYFASFIGVSETQISVCISTLKKRGYIYQERFDGRYRILRSNLRIDFKKTSRQTLRKLKGRLKENLKYNNTKSNIVNNKINSESKNSLKRKEFRVPVSDYKEITDAYQQYKGIKLSGAEFGEVKRAIKTILYSERTKKDIIDFMKWVSGVCKEIEEGNEEVERKFGWLSNWTMLTIKRKLPEFLAGKFQYDDMEVDIPSYAKK